MSLVLSKNTVSFLGLGIENFELDSVAFSFGDFSVYWYGVMITCGIIFAFLYAAFRGKYEGVSFDDLIDIALWTVILGVVGARLYYVLTSLDQYIPEPFNFIEFIKGVFNLRNGGLAIYGGIICGILGIVIATGRKKINTLKLFDMAGPGVMLAQAIGRWGNFFNGEAFGEIVSEGHPLYFMRMGLISRNTVGDFGTTDMVFVHPTFLYESLWNILGFILINILYKKKKFNGQMACIYLAWYGFGRFFIEGLRTDSLYVGVFRISQVVGLLCFVAFSGLLVAGLIYSKAMATEGHKERAIDKYLVPSLDLNPVFFEKKKKEEVNSEKENEEATPTTEEKTEEDKSGTDN